MRRLLPLMLLFTLAVGVAPSARAGCAPPPVDAFTLRQMIREGDTNNPEFNRMILGKVRSIKDAGEVGGQAVAVIVVRAHPTGWTPLIARVRFYRQRPGSWIEDNVAFHVGKAYAVIARHLADGTYEHDGGCGSTKHLQPDRFRSLLRLAAMFD